MTVRQLHKLLRGLDDTHEIVVARRGRDGDVLREVWRAAQDEADRADAALDALVASVATAR